MKLEETLKGALRTELTGGLECGSGGEVLCTAAWSQGLHLQHKPGMAVYTCNPNTWKVEAGRGKVQGRS